MIPQIRTQSPPSADQLRLQQDARASRQAIGHGLRTRLDGVLQEPLPRQWLEILRLADGQVHQERS